jgi:hypothetical protein
MPFFGESRLDGGEWVVIVNVISESVVLFQNLKYATAFI